MGETNSENADLFFSCTKVKTNNRKFFIIYLKHRTGLHTGQLSERHKSISCSMATLWQDMKTGCNGARLQ